MHDRKNPVEMIGGVPDLAAARALPITAGARMPDGDSAPLEGTLRASVAAGISGPVVILSGEADLTSVGQLSALITAQLSGGHAS